jgi:hypothetical protein
MRVCLRHAAMTLMVSVLACTGAAQSAHGPDTSARRSSRVSLAIMAGYVAPQSKHSLTQFWEGGPGASVCLLMRAAPGFWVGTGLDVSALWFLRSRFGEAYPSVEVKAKHMAWVNLYLLSRYGFIPRGSVHPYIQVAIGGSRLSGAEYKEVIDSVRVTYYEVPARTRMALTCTGGLEIPVARGFSFLAEAAVRYVHNDPNMGIGLLISGGARITL